MLSKDYDPKAVEAKWQKIWEEREIYRFDEKNLDNIYVIDTPPPYPTGRMHLGHALNWVYMDIIARYKRMRGFNVLYPQGWDCHGLPTEVKVEETHKIKKNDLPQEKFRQLCIELTERNIARMRQQMKSLGYSIDWSREYVTLRPDYIRRVQYSFLKMYEQGLIYRGEHPVNWCPRCETAIAYAEVEYEERETYLNYLKFRTDDSHILIATTRPELLPACVAIAVHPEDARYRQLVGKTARVPIFGQQVKIIADKDVDPSFGTGIVMICTFGDKQDVEWVKKHSLPVIRAIDREGKITEAGGRYMGLSVVEAKNKILGDLEAQDYVEKREKLQQNVGACWRCKTPIEILIEEQWFVNVRKMREEILAASKRMNWYPDYMEVRLRTWVENMNWDWVISRQRIFATPIPVWYCASCGETIIAKEEHLPVFPNETNAPVKTCPKCGSTKFVPETDVLDTWMDSSITPLSICNWPDNTYLFSKLYPSDLRPQGHEIIRTWAFYTITRCLALTGKEPFKNLLINGMVLAEDGRKMSKSLGNVVEPDDLVAEYGADSLRQWAAMGGAPGNDIPFAEKDIKFGNRFLRKLWNAARFAEQFVKEEVPKPKDMDVLDLWILSRVNRLARAVTEYLDAYRFDRAILEIHSFAWHEFCDEYIEAIKHRLYSEKAVTKQAAQFTLRKVLYMLLKLLSPFVPHFCDEIYSQYFSHGESIHATRWIEVEEEYIDEEAEKTGKLVSGVIASVRRYKSEHGLPLNAELPRLTIYAKENASALERGRETILGTLRVKELRIEAKSYRAEENVLSIVPNYASLGPEFKEDAKRVVAFLNSGDKNALARELSEKGRIVLALDGRRLAIEQRHIKEIKKEIISEGEKVEVIPVPECADITIMVPKATG